MNLPFPKLLYLSIDIAFCTECSKFRAAYLRLAYGNESTVRTINERYFGKIIDLLFCRLLISSYNSYSSKRLALD